MALPPYLSGLTSRIVAEVTEFNAANIQPIADQAEAARDDAQQAVVDATAQVALAEAAVAATFKDAGVYVPVSEAVEVGGFFADFSIPAGVTYTRLFARILGGSGTVDVTMLDDGYPVHGPVTVTYGTDTDATISEVVATGSDIQFFFSNITGAPMGIICKVEGAPA